MMMCRHCGKEKASRPRGLGWKCYYSQGIRELYPSTSKHANRGVGNGYRAVRLDTVVSDAPPGSEERLAVLERRAAAGLSLFHPDEPVAERRPSARPGVSRSCTPHRGADLERMSDFAVLNMLVTNGEGWASEAN